MTTPHALPLDRIVDHLRRRRDCEISLADVVALAEITAQSLEALVATMDAAVQGELREIASYIGGIKHEIGALQANDIREQRIPAAGQELDAIVRATEEATNTILQCAETVMAADASDPGAYKARVDKEMMLIFEACAFHDLTGQRIAKVLDALQQIEQRVSRFAAAMRVKDASGPLNEHERARADRRKRLLLHGPAGDTEAEVSTQDAQSEIDRLFA